MSIENFLWVERYRPKTIDECILSDSVKNTFKDFIKTGEIPHLLLSGSAGVGKCLHPDEPIDIWADEETASKIQAFLSRV